MPRPERPLVCLCRLLGTAVHTCPAPWRWVRTVSLPPSFPIPPVRRARPRRGAADCAPLVKPTHAAPPRASPLVRCHTFHEDIGGGGLRGGGVGVWGAGGGFPPAPAPSSGVLSAPSPGAVGRPVWVSPPRAPETAVAAGALTLTRHPVPCLPSTSPPQSSKRPSRTNVCRGWRPGPGTMEPPPSPPARTGRPCVYTRQWPPYTASAMPGTAGSLPVASPAPHPLRR